VVLDADTLICGAFTIIAIKHSLMRNFAWNQEKRQRPVDTHISIGMRAFSGKSRHG
jgi:hypothetical protein